MKHAFMILIILLASGCQTSPNLPLPTSDVLPTATNRPLPTRQALPPTFTPIAQPATAIVLAPLPTPTNRATTDCENFVPTVLQTAIQFCDSTGVGEICHAHTGVRVQPVPLNLGERVSVAEVTQIEALALVPERQTWGIAVLRPDSQTHMVLFGGVVLRSLVFEAELRALSFRSTPSPACQSAPWGVLLQTTEETTYEINGADVVVDGTVALDASDTAMTLSTLEGEARLIHGSRVQVVPAGGITSIPLGSGNYVDGPPQPLTADNETHWLAFSDLVWSPLLSRPITPAPRLTTTEVAPFNTYDAIWAVRAEVVSVTSEENDRSYENCTWPAAYMAGGMALSDFTVFVNAVTEDLVLDGYFPGVPFPATWSKTSTDPPGYTGIVQDESGTAVHEVVFSSATQLTWRVEVSDITDGSCQGGVIEGTGERLIPEEPASNLTGAINGPWNVGLSQQSGDCPLRPNLPDLPTAIILTLTADPASGKLLLSTEQTDLSIPPALDLTDSANVFSGTSTVGERTYAHTVWLTDTNVFRWQVIVKDELCIFTTIEGIGFRF